MAHRLLVVVNTLDDLGKFARFPKRCKVRIRREIINQAHAGKISQSG
jgi:hypothetical protein